MADPVSDASETLTAGSVPAAPAPSATLAAGTYEVIRERLTAQASAFRERMQALDAKRQEIFGSIESKILKSERVNTPHNCIPKDMVRLGENRFLFGFNVRFGLKQEVAVRDVFGIFLRDGGDGSFREDSLSPLEDKSFLTDFQRIHTVYEKTSFSKFSIIEGHLYMVFQTGSSASDIAVFKWAVDGEKLRYVDGRAEAEFRRIGFPPQYNFRWNTPGRDAYRYGEFPHVSIEDRVFVECIGGTLTVKIEDNTSRGEGIHSEPVDDKRQKVDDAEIAYARLGHLILLRIRPYKETHPRFLIFNEKTSSVDRVDSIGLSCAALPEDHGLVFPDGYYLGTGELKLFGSQSGDHTLERIVHSPNGEDSLYVFYSRTTGEYVLLPYRLIVQKIEERITCHGFSLFPNGHLVLFRADNEPQKHHSIQLRQTPYYQPGFEPAGKSETYLYQVGNKEIVRCLAECNEVLTLVSKDTIYQELYTDVVNRCGGILDGYPWLSHAECGGLDASLRDLREVSNRAVDEFDKVRRLQQEAGRKVADIRARCSEQFHAIRRSGFKVLEEFVRNLAALRGLTGELITLRDVRYIDGAALTQLETEVAQANTELSGKCVEFLLKPEAMEPYRLKADGFLSSAEAVAKVSDAKKIEEAVAATGAELEMLIEIVNALRIGDATETTRIIDSITAVYTMLNQVRGALKNRLKSLVASESAAQFAAQMKLLGQSASSYLDLCDTPTKCDDYLNRISVQIEEMEGAFAEFDEFIVQIADRRAELYEAFEQRKVAMVEALNRRTSGLMTSSERILKAVANRLASLKTLEEINSSLASDVMISKVRETVTELLKLGDSVKADDLSTKLKSLGQEAIRQFKDRQELFQEGPGIIRLGNHSFNINTQAFDLTVVHREGGQFLHLAGTRFYEPVSSPEFLETLAAWDQEFRSETQDVYRAETLAYELMKSIESEAPDILQKLLDGTSEFRLKRVQEFMAAKHQDGYVRGLHDLDGEKIFQALGLARNGLGLARFRPAARACAIVYWLAFCPDEQRSKWVPRLKGFSERNRVFPDQPASKEYIQELANLLAGFAKESGLYPPSIASEAAEYLFLETTGSNAFVRTRQAEDFIAAFNQHLVGRGAEAAFQAALDGLSAHPGARLELIRDWLKGFVSSNPGSFTEIEEASAMIFAGTSLTWHMVSASTTVELQGMKGSHARIVNGTYHFDFLGFHDRMANFIAVTLPLFERYHSLKQGILDAARAELRIEEFQPKVLTSFVRNQLIDEVYLPLVGDNLAKQIGTAGDTKRTDRSGLLLLVSPPGYGKTTLLEYLASRLGIVFVKINGPAIGFQTTSLDPEEAPNAAAREEIHKLNLALEMGDNVMICVDDIQHCHAEFLQKFISLCDAQRKIEGVWRGKTRTHDLRGRKVVVVMAGNPYTETGQKFRLPDMLANRADTYNLGDILGGKETVFKASYIENAVTSNPVLAPLANRSQRDIRTFLRMAEGAPASLEDLEGQYAAQEVEEILSVLKKLIAVREVILAVNQEYIRSAAQSDDYRTEPAFKLQGSYRNMNRLAARIVSIMNEDEVRALILDHYRNESQTLTSDTEANLLKLRELLQLLTPEESQRWEDIKATFRKNLATRNPDGSNDPVGRVVGQLSTFGEGLASIKQTLEAGVDAMTSASATEHSDRMRSVIHELEMVHATMASLRDMSLQQRDYLQSVREQLALRAKQGVIEFEVTDEMLSNEQQFLDRFQQMLAERRASGA